jgi:uncharacterized protein YegL
MAKKKVTKTVTTTVTEEIVETQRKVTRVVLVIDRSGSMHGVRKAAFDGINEQINVLKRTADSGGETFVTYVQFDDQFDTVFENKNAKHLTFITEDQYDPRGWTAMYDAVGRAVRLLQKQTREDEDTAYLVVVISDGAENASKEFNAVSVSKLVTELKATGNWTFTMMLSNVDLSVAKNLGVDYGNSIQYTSTVEGTRGAFVNMAAATTQYMASRDSGSKAVLNFYRPSDNTVSDTHWVVSGSVVLSNGTSTTI